MTTSTNTNMLYAVCCMLRLLMLILIFAHARVHTFYYHIIIVRRPPGVLRVSALIGCLLASYPPYSQQQWRVSLSLLQQPKLIFVVARRSILLLIASYAKTNTNTNTYNRNNNYFMTAAL